MDIAQIESLVDLPLYPLSVAPAGEATLFLVRGAAGKRLAVLARPADPLLALFAGEPVERQGWQLLLCLPDGANAESLRACLPWLRPAPLGLRPSAGCGDRIGLATPGHVRAARACPGALPGLGMIFAQQSIREMTRSARSAQAVMDDATWGLFQEGWGVPGAGGAANAPAMGTDADHLKTPADIDLCVAAGFTFFTIDPSEHVDGRADDRLEPDLRAAYAALPWSDLDSRPAALLAAYRGRRFAGEGRAWQLDEATLVRAAVKYGRAVAHTARLYRHLAAVMRGPFDLELSIDETDTPTTHAEHVFIAAELRRLGVKWTGLAPRYAGSFEKAVDYIGDLAEFERSFAGHAAIARALGPYKLSLHSGSDKFSIYPIAARQARGLLHLKTAGTSYLEALRALAGFDPPLFREILAFSLARFPTDRASYHVSTRLERVPAPSVVPDDELPALLDQPDTRQVLHLTFGSVLNPEHSFRPRLLAGLAAHEEEHYAALERHFIRHLQPLFGGAGVRKLLSDGGFSAASGV